MSTKTVSILGSIQALPISEQRELWQELGRRIGQTAIAKPGELYGEPLTDGDIEESARVAFRALDEEEKSAETR